ncbi:MAG: hypothetical protein ACREL9_07555 [Gemmatimonadales bacterium]
MKGYALLLATGLSLAYGYAAQAAIAADQARVFGGTRPPAAAAARSAPVYYGGTLDPITVVAPTGSNPHAGRCV